jgi:hypothetical protein
MERVLTAGEHLLFVTLTSTIAVVGGVLMWIGFACLGLIMRRYERVFGRTTHWQFLTIAPAGLVAYLVMQSIASVLHQNMGPIEQWTGYTLLTWSALLCVWGILRFRQVLAKLEAES